MVAEPIGVCPSQPKEHETTTIHHHLFRHRDCWQYFRLHHWSISASERRSFCCCSSCGSIPNSDNIPVDAGEQNKVQHFMPSLWYHTNTHQHPKGSGTLHNTTSSPTTPWSITSTRGNFQETRSTLKRQRGLAPASTYRIPISSSSAEQNFREDSSIKDPPTNLSTTWGLSKRWPSIASCFFPLGGPGKPLTRTLSGHFLDSPVFGDTRQDTSGPSRDSCSWMGSCKKRWTSIIRGETTTQHQAKSLGTHIENNKTTSSSASKIDKQLTSALAKKHLASRVYHQKTDVKQFKNDNPKSEGIPHWEFRGRHRDPQPN